MFSFDLNTIKKINVIFENNYILILNYIDEWNYNNTNLILEESNKAISTKKVYIIRPLESIVTLNKKIFDNRVKFISNDILLNQISELCFHFKCYIDCLLPNFYELNTDKQFTLSFLSHRFQPNRFEFFKLVHKNLKDDFIVSFNNVTNETNQQSKIETKNNIDLPYHKNINKLIQHSAMYISKDVLETGTFAEPYSIQNFYDDTLLNISKSYLNFYFETGDLGVGGTACISEKSLLPFLAKAISIPLSTNKEIIPILENVGFKFLFEELELPKIYNDISIYDTFLKKLTPEFIKKIYYDNYDKIEHNYNLAKQIQNCEFKF
jgi:hypothetical protein